LGIYRIQLILKLWRGERSILLNWIYRSDKWTISLYFTNERVFSGPYLV